MHPHGDPDTNLRGGSAARDAAELRHGASTLRKLVPTFRDSPVSEFVPIAVAKLLDAVAACLESGDPVRHDVRESALEIARHVRTHPYDPA